MSTGTIIDDIERVPAHLTKCLSMLENWEERLNFNLTSLKEGKMPDASMAKQLNEITKTSMAMAKEMRAWVGKVTEAVESLSLEDRVRVALTMIQELSSGDRLNAYNHIRQLEASRPDGGLAVSAGARPPKMTHAGDSSE